MTKEEIEKAAEAHADKHYFDDKMERRQSEEDFKAGYRASQEVQRWTSVKERLPETTGAYLCFMSHGHQNVLPFYAGFGWNCPSENKRHNEITDVAFWMPLLPAPEGGE